MPLLFPTAPAVLQSGSAAPATIAVATCASADETGSAKPKALLRSEMTEAQRDCYAEVERATSAALSEALEAVRATPIDSGWRRRLNDLNAAHCAAMNQDASVAFFAANGTRFALPPKATLDLINGQLATARTAKALRQVPIQAASAIRAAAAFQMLFTTDHNAWNRCMAAALK